MGRRPGDHGERGGAAQAARRVGPARRPFRLPRLGAPLGAFHASLLHCLLPQLSSPRLAVRKRAVGALGHLAAACSSDLFVELADHLLDRLPGPRAPASPAAIRTLIQCLGSIGRQAGHRLGKGAGPTARGGAEDGVLGEGRGLGALPPWSGDVVGWGGAEERGGAGVGLEHLEEKGWAQEAAGWALSLICF